MLQVLYNSPTLHGSSVQHQGYVGTLQNEHTAAQDHQMHGSGSRRDGEYKRAPRRAQTHHNYQIPQPPVAHGINAPLRQAHRQPEGFGRIEEAISPLASDDEDKELHLVPEPRVQLRPPLGPPRRSYSVMDCEPIPHHHRLSPRMVLLDLPPEMHYAIFDFLDPIDSTCFGLTNKHFYAIHRRMRGSVRLSARRDGPNELEWAWHLAGAVVHAPPSSLTQEQKVMLQGLNDREKNALSKLRIRGQAYCRKCGITRCELHKHLESWMGDGLEYCSITEKFGPVAAEGARSYCYMRKPGDPHRCGRHLDMRKSKVTIL